MDSLKAFSAKIHCFQLERLRERLWRLNGAEGPGDPARQARYWYRLTQRSKDPRDVLRWYANDSML